MKREIPPVVFVVAIIVVLGVVGYFFYRSNRTPQGAGVTKEELRREFMQRAQSGQLPISPEQLKKMQQAQPK